MIPFYNTPPSFLAEAIESVLAQTYAHWELLLVDDGSTQAASSQTAQSYAAAHPDKIRYLAHSGHANKGLGLSRQLALEQSRGELIALLDADDLWLPPKLTEQVALLVAHEAVGAVYGRTKYWHSWNNQSPIPDHTPPTGLPPHTILPPPQLLNLFVRQQIAIPCTCSIIFRRNALSGTFEAGIDGFFYEDQMLYAKICLQHSVLVADVCWDYYRQHAGSGTQLTRNQEIERHLLYLHWLADYVRQQNVTDTALWQALRDQIWLHQSPKWAPKPLHRFIRMGKKRVVRL
jgi:glycosyltransferase involved in cell wall biosynthesis